MRDGQEEEPLMVPCITHNHSIVFFCCGCCCYSEADHPQAIIRSVGDHSPINSLGGLEPSKIRRLYTLGLEPDHAAGACPPHPP